MKRFGLIFCTLLMAGAAVANGNTRTARPAVQEMPEQKHESPSKRTPEYIKTRLQLIYALVFNTIETGRTSLSDYFFSEEFRALNRTADELTPAGETGYYDYDPWLQAQNCDHPKAKVCNVHDITENSAIADVIVYPFGQNTDSKGISVRVALRYENGDWFISNFNDDRAGLQHYIDNQR